MLLVEHSDSVGSGAPEIVDLLAYAHVQLVKNCGVVEESELVEVGDVRNLVSLADSSCLSRDWLTS